MDEYLDLKTYNEIYSELVYQRNHYIDQFRQFGMTGRNRYATKDDNDEWTRHRVMLPTLMGFQVTIPQILNRLYSYDATEALYDFDSIDMGSWSETPANRLEKQIQALQHIISKLENRYDLQYRLLFDFEPSSGTLTLNTNKVLASGKDTLRTRMLTALFSDRQKHWKNDDIEEYFVENFDYQYGELSDKNIAKAARDINKDIATNTGVQDFLNFSNSSVQITSRYVT